MLTPGKYRLSRAPFSLSGVRLAPAPEQAGPLLCVTQISHSSHRPFLLSQSWPGAVGLGDWEWGEGMKMAVFRQKVC